MNGMPVSGPAVTVKDFPLFQRGDGVADILWSMCRGNDAQRLTLLGSRKLRESPYRLLSESEREYAAPAGTTTPFWLESLISTKLANYDGSATYADGKSGEFRGHTLPVDTFDANPFGLHPPNGNVYDWVEDCWHATYQGALRNGGARTTGDCGRRVLRGGSWYDGTRDVTRGTSIWILSGLSLRQDRVSRRTFVMMPVLSAK